MAFYLLTQPLPWVWIGKNRQRNKKPTPSGQIEKFFLSGYSSFYQDKENLFRVVAREPKLGEREGERKKTERQIWINVHDVIQFF